RRRRRRPTARTSIPYRRARPCDQPTSTPRNRDGGIRALSRENTIELPYVLLFHEAMGGHRHQTFHDILRSRNQADCDSVRELRDLLNRRRIIWADSGADFPTPLANRFFGRV